MKNQVKKTFLFSLATLMASCLTGLFLIFFTYKYYTSYIDGKEFEQFTLKARIKETGNVLIQTVKERKNYKKYINSLDIKPNDNILDFGAGYGNEAVFIIDKLDEQSGHLTCIDINEMVLDIAKKRLEKYSNVIFISNDINKISLPENSFNKIILYYVLHSIDKRILDETLKTLCKVLAKSGKIFIREPEHHGYSLQHIRLILTKNGFAEEEINTTKVPAGIDAVFIKK